MIHNKADQSNTATQHPPEKNTPRDKPFSKRMQRLLAGKPQEDTILDPDNPNLMAEKRQRTP